MGSGSSVLVDMPERLNREEAKQVAEGAGITWSKGWEDKFSKVADGEGTVDKATCMAYSPMKAVKARKSDFKNLKIHNPEAAKADSEARSAMKRRATAAGQGQIGVESQKKKSVADVKESNAATKLQAQARRRQSVLDTQTRRALQINIAMEYEMERKDVKVSKTIGKAIKATPALMNNPAYRMNGAGESKFDHRIKNGWPGKMKVDKNYKGPALETGKITLDKIYEIVDFYFKQLANNTINGSKVVRLAPKYICMILSEFLKLNQTLPNVQQASTAVSKTVTVVGDLHGQLRDLAEIFSKNGNPSAMNPYVFNGDLVDRGQQSLEVCVILMGFAVADPQCVKINRGNHEDYAICEEYGFIEEIFEKYGNTKFASTIADLFAEVFAFMPLAAVIDGTILVIHGGISGRFNLEMLNKVPRSHYKTLQGVPPELWLGEDCADGSAKYADWISMMDALWSDPVDDMKGWEENMRRGAGACWGPDCTEKWVNEHNLTHIVRSHECVENGFELLHGGRVMTLFSASNYYVGETNLGAYLKLNSDNEELPMEMFQYCTNDGKSAAAGNWQSQVKQMEDSACERASIILYEYKSKLAKCFAECDKDKKGYVTLSQWAEIMRQVIPIKLPWVHLASHFVAADNGRIDYNFFIDSMEASANLDGDETVIPEHVYRYLPELEQMFRMMNTDGTGHLTTDQFNSMFDALNGVAGDDMKISKGDRDMLLKSMDPTGAGDIKFVDFLNSVKHYSLDGGGVDGEGGDYPPTDSEDEGDGAAAAADADTGRRESEMEAPMKKVRPRGLSTVIKAPIKKAEPAEAEGDAAAAAPAAKTNLRTRRASAVGKMKGKAAGIVPSLLGRSKPDDDDED